MSNNTSNVFVLLIFLVFLLDSYFITKDKITKIWALQLTQADKRDTTRYVLMLALSKHIIHLLFKICSIVARLVISGSSMWAINSLQLGTILSAIRDGKATDFVKMVFNIFGTFESSKGIEPHTYALNTFIVNEKYLWYY